jgi:hypothetical protein
MDQNPVFAKLQKPKSLYRVQAKKNIFTVLFLPLSKNKNTVFLLWKMCKKRWLNLGSMCASFGEFFFR